jgi:hypothetical protein
VSAFVSFRVVSCSALGSGGCAAWVFRPSSRSFSGFVVSASFLSFAFASRFASRWASRLGFFVAVRRAGSLWSVSVPCWGASGAPAWVSVLSRFRFFGFSGSRSVVSPACGSVASFLRRSRPVCGAVGCAGGVDSFFRSAFPSLSVFRASSFGRGRGAFAARSVAVVRAVASAGGLWVSFPSSPCPSGLVPSGVSSRAFGGFRSGSWASLAFACGLGVPCLVFLPSGVEFPPSWLLFGFVPLGGDVWFFAG